MVIIHPRRVREVLTMMTTQVASVKVSVRDEASGERGMLNAELCELGRPVREKRQRVSDWRVDTLLLSSREYVNELGDELFAT
jgi:hypothetical protein